MRMGHLIVFCVALSTAMPVISAELKLPNEVTPALRAACETDVRRLCIGSQPTIAKVKSCVFAKFLRLGKRCQFELAAAGFR